MRWIKAHAWNLFLLGLMMLCFGTALASSSKFQTGGEVYMLYEKKQPWNGSGAIKIQEDDDETDVPLKFTFWGTDYKADISFPLLERQATADITYICGDSDLLFNESSRLLMDDREGCLISSDVAYNLFGTTDTSGQVIALNGREYVVRGTLNDSENTIVIQADEKLEEKLDSIAVYIPEDKMASEILQLISSRHAITSEGVSFYTFVRWGRFFVLLLPIIIGFLLFIPIIRTVYRQRKSPYLLAVSIAGAVSLLVLYIWICEFNFQFPADLIPNSWSDFDFWTTVIEGKKSQFWTLILSEKREPERVLAETFMQTAKYSLFVLFFFLFFLRKVRVESSRDLFIYNLFLLLTAFLTIWYHKGQGNILVSSKCFWFLMIFYYTVQYLYDRRDKLKMIASGSRTP